MFADETLHICFGITETFQGGGLCLRPRGADLHQTKL